MVKRIVLVILAVALLVDVSGFLALGVGTGALAAVGTGPGGTTTSSAANYQSSPALEGNDYGDGLSWLVDLTTVSQSGQAPITAMLPGYESTPVTFGLHGYSHGDCGNQQTPAWAPGVGSNYGYYQIQYLVNGQPQTISAQIDGAPETSSNSLFVTANNSGLVWFCGLTTGGGDDFTHGLGIQSTIYVPHTLSLTGIYPNGQLSISFHVEWTWCNGNGFTTSGAVCQAAQNALPVNAQLMIANGAGQGTTTATTNVVSAGASVQVLNPQGLYNGQQLNVAVTTGYAGPNGYTLEVLCPSPRSCGGQADPSFSPISVPNFVLGARTFSWTIPHGYAVNASTPAYNTIVVVLLANYGVVAQSLAYPVTISPVYNPAQPVIGYSTGSGAVYPGIGDTVTITVWANVSKSSASIANISLEIFYLTAGETAASAPPCGSSWVTASCPFGQLIDVHLNGRNATGTFTFIVQPPLGSVAIGGSAIAYTTTSQANTSVPFFLNIQPAGCKTGNACDPTTTQVSEWSVWGPILFVVAIALAVAMAVVYFPLTMTYRVIIVVVAGIVLVLAYSSIALAFLPGGALGGTA